MGSEAYGVSSGGSDRDIYGFAIPPQDVVFPHLRGEVIGFGRQHKRFEQFQQHHVQDADSGVQYDIQIFSIVKYFHLLMENNPNIIDSLFTPAECVVHSTAVGNMVREHRRIFLHKGAWFKFRGYSFSQVHKMSNKSPIGKRLATIQAFGFDVKHAYHVVRLLDEIEQILTVGDIDLRRNAEQLKAIRRGEMTEDAIRRWFTEKERQLEALYASSTLPYGPDEEKIKQLLLDCLEHHYGSLEAACIVPANAADLALEEIAAIVHRYEQRSATQPIAEIPD